MSHTANHQAADEQSLHDLMEGNYAGEYSEDDGAEETVPIRGPGTASDQADDGDLPALVPTGPPPPPPPRPRIHQPTLGSMRSTGTILGRNPAPQMAGMRMGTNPAYSPRATHAHISPRTERSDSKAYKSPLQPQHFDNLKSADEWPVWERRFRSHLRSIPGYGEQLEVGYESLIDSVKQEEILNFLIQKVHDPNGFDKLLTVEGEALKTGEVSSRGRRLSLRQL